MQISTRLAVAQGQGRESLKFGGSGFGAEALRAVMVAIWISILSPCRRWPLVDPHALPPPVKPGKSHQIVANETADPRTSEQARSTDGWHFSGDALRFLSCGERPRAGGALKL